MHANDLLEPTPVFRGAKGHSASAKSHAKFPSEAPRPETPKSQHLRSNPKLKTLRKKPDSVRDLVQDLGFRV